MFEFNILLSRFINRIDTLESIGYVRVFRPYLIRKDLETRAASGQQIWGSAYVVTTHGIAMPKLQYLCDNVLESAARNLEAVKKAIQEGSLASTARALERIEGVASFMSGQIVADLKNTEGHKLIEAEDWWTFVQPGPGSLRGASWFFYNQPKGVTVGDFHDSFLVIRKYVDENWPIPEEGAICNQDLQNCLCEFDKYMRVKYGTGRSKRGYNGV
jgi:hypothetical protein